MSGVLSVQTSDGLDIDIPLTYAGDALPGYNSGNISLSTPSQTVEYQVTAIRNINLASSETIETRRAYFDTETRRWVETEGLLTLSALSDLRVLLGSDLHETSDIATAGQMALTGQETLDGLETRVISGKLSGAEIAGTDTELEVTYRIGMDDALLRQIEVSGDLDPSIIGALIDGLSADSVRAELTVNFSDYGKDVAYKSPYLAEARFGHNATLLDDGRVLVSGGYVGGFYNDELLGFLAASSQTYDPLTGTWAIVDQSDPTASDVLPELSPHTSPTRLPDGRLISVAILGGPRYANDSFIALAVFDANTGEWTHLSDVSVPTDRSSPDMIVLDDGRVLVLGGSEIIRSPSDSFTPLGIVEAYDLSTGVWQTLEPMNQPAFGRSLVPLNDGRILAAGGFTGDPGMGKWSSGVEIYDPDTNRWMSAENMIVPRILPQSVVLPDGRVLVTGSDFSQSVATNNSPDSETYDPATGKWTAAAAMLQRIYANHTLTLLPDGRVLAVGGLEILDDGNYVPLSTTEIFDPITNTWSPGPDLSQPRASHSATLMPDGSVLIVGGISEQNGQQYVTVSTEIIEP